MTVNREISTLNFILEILKILFLEIGEPVPTCSKYLPQLDRIASTQKSLSSTVVSSPKLSQISKPRILQQSQNNDPIQSQEKVIPSQVSLINSPQLSVISKEGDWTPGLRKGAFVSSTPAAALLTQKDALTEIQNLGLNTRKRRLEALFGDIYDIQEEEDAFYKKQKTDEERDYETIERILEARKKFQEHINPMKKSNLDRLENLHKFKTEYLSERVPKWPFLTVLRNDSERIYVRFHSEEFETMKINEISCFNRNGRSLLGNDKEAIWDQARQIVLHSTEIQNTPAIIEEIQQQPMFNADLWVEKYRPKKYIDLLSDESTNRSLLQWLKLWDKVVFNREVKKKDEKKGQLNSFNKKTGKFEYGGWKSRNKHNLNTDLDANNVPVQKIALLCGPPGLGKTTLASIIAKHCGYSILEQNASDDRSVEAFRQALENGTQMTSVLNRDNRPNCIILDEIDGAPHPSIDYLIRFVTGQVNQKSKKGKTAKKFILKRPIICICNDVYATSLRQLRQIAFVVNFTAIESSRLAERLQHIAIREKIKTDLTALLALAEKTGNDIRSCLTVLQFHR
jgi:chromosome transmission fidelity protein 18